MNYLVTRPNGRHFLFVLFAKVLPILTQDTKQVISIWVVSITYNPLKVTLKQYYLCNESHTTCWPHRLNRLGRSRDATIVNMQYFKLIKPHLLNNYHHKYYKSVTTTPNTFPRECNFRDRSLLVILILNIDSFLLTDLS